MDLTLTPQPSHLPDAEQPLRELAQILAHRLRGLVASIEGFTDLLAETLPGRDQREMALRILEGTARIEAVLSELQVYSRPISPVCSHTPLAEILETLLLALDDDDTLRISLDLHLSPRTSIYADAFLLRQALLALLQNALDATGPAGAVRLTVKQGTEPGRIEFAVWNEGAIEIGQPVETVFIPFFTTKAKNLGVGLPMARRILETHGGTLILSASDPSEGTTFTAALPVAM